MDQYFIGIATLKGNTRLDAGVCQNTEKRPGEWNFSGLLCKKLALWVGAQQLLKLLAWYKGLAKADSIILHFSKAGTLSDPPY